MEKIFSYLTDFIALAITVFVVIIVFLIVQFLFKRNSEKSKNDSVVKQIVFGLFFFVALVVIVMALPIDGGLKGQVIGLIGILFSATIALGSTTFLGNAFAGLMNKIVGAFEIGDYIEVGSHFGRVSDKGLFHTEIQTANRDLVTLPNLFLATNPVRVMRNSGTVISTEVSLGYDVPRSLIEKCLKEAALKAELVDPFVFVTSLGDYSVVYKVHGMLNNIDLCLTGSSKLNKMVLDELHAAKIEIVSPSFMNQKQIGDTVFIPKKVNIKEEKEEASLESIIFDKAMKAETLISKKERLEELEARIESMKEEMKTLDDDTEKEKLKAKIEKWTKTLESTKEKLIQERTELENEDSRTKE